MKEETTDLTPKDILEQLKFLQIEILKALKRKATLITELNKVNTAIKSLDEDRERLLNLNAER